MRQGAAETVRPHFLHVLIETIDTFGRGRALPGVDALLSKQMGTCPKAFIYAAEGSVLLKVVKLVGT